MKSDTPIMAAAANRHHPQYDCDLHAKAIWKTACELERSHAALLAALKSLSNDGKGSFKDWEDGEGVNIQEELETLIKNAENLCASAAHQNAAGERQRT